MEMLIAAERGLAARLPCLYSKGAHRIYLARLPVNTLKIDRSLVVEMTAAPERLALVPGNIQLACSLKPKSVAQRFETRIPAPPPAG